jgi:hypothetical protein
MTKADRKNLKAQQYHAIGGYGRGCGRAFWGGSRPVI